MDMKKLMEIKEVPYTIMNSSLSAIWGLIFAVILVIASLIAYGIGAGSGIGKILLGVLGFSIGSIISFPLLIFLTSLGSNFLFALVFNVVSPKVGAIQVGFEDNSKLSEIDPVSYGIILAVMSIIPSLLWNLAIQPMIYFSLAASIEPFMILSFLGSIIGTIIGAGIGGFVVGILFAVTYNFIIKYVSPITVKFESRGHGFDELVEIEPFSTSLSITLVHTFWTAIFTILVVIIAAIVGIFVPALIIGIIVIIATFLVSFVVLYFSAYIYNILVTKIGGVKLRFEDVDGVTKANDIKEITKETKELEEVKEVKEKSSETDKEEETEEKSSEKKEKEE